jgi:hypothetical protein
VVEPIDDVMGDPVALVFEVEDLAGELLVVRILGEQVVEQRRGAEHVLPRLLEQFEVDAIPRGEHLGEPCHSP